MTGRPEITERLDVMTTRRQNIGLTKRQGDRNIF